jgi:hypothetical protein
MLLGLLQSFCLHGKKSQPLIRTETNINNDQMIQDFFYTKLTFCTSEHTYNHWKNGSTVLPLFSEILDVLDIISRTSRSDLLVCLFPILPIFNTVVIYCYLLVKYAGEL